MPYIVPLLFFFLIHSLGQAQVKQAKKYIKKERYETALELLETAQLAEDKLEAIEAGIELSKLHTDYAFEQANEYKAYLAIMKSKELYETLKTKERIEAQKKDLSLNKIQHRERELTEKRYQRVMSRQNVAELDSFINYYHSRNNIQDKEVQELRNYFVFKHAELEQSYSGYEQCYKKYGESMREFSQQIDTLLQAALFESYIEKNGWYAFGTFAVKYPENVYVQDSSAAVRFITLSRSKDYLDYERFTHKYRGSPFVKIAIDSIVSLTLQQEKDLSMYDYIVRNHPKHRRIEEVWLRFRKLYSAAKSEEEFELNYPQAKKSD